MFTRATRFWPKAIWMTCDEHGNFWTTAYQGSNDDYDDDARNSQWNSWDSQRISPQSPAFFFFQHPSWNQCSSTGFLNIIVPAGCVECTLSASACMPQLVRGGEIGIKKARISSLQEKTTSLGDMLWLCAFLLFEELYCVDDTEEEQFQGQSESMVFVLKCLHILVDVVQGFLQQQ